MSRCETGASGRSWAALTVLALVAAVAAGAVELTPILPPSFEGVDPAVQELLGTKLAELETLVPESAAEIPAAEAEALAAGYGELGRLYLVYSLPESAESCLVNARRLDPKRFEWVYLLGTLHQERGDLGAAREFLGDALRLDPADASARLRLAQLEFELGAAGAAEALYRPLLEEPGFAAAASYGLGRIAVAAGDLEAAAAHFERAVEEQPEASQPRYQLALVYRRLGRGERARQQLERRGSSRLSFPDPLLERLAEGVRGAEIYLAAGRKSRRQGDLDEAVLAFHRAVEEDPADPAHRRILAATLQQAGRVAEAIEVYREGLRLDPDDAGMLYNLATALTSRGDAAQAAPLLERVVELAPDHADGRVNLAAIYEEWGRLGDAERLLREAIDIDPYDNDLVVRHAEVLTALGRAGEARRVLAEVVGSDPADARARLALGNALAAQGATDEAIAAWRQAARLGADPPTAAEAHFQLGRALTGQGRAAEAVTELREAVKLLPGNRQLRLALAGALGAAGDFDAAAAEYAAAIEAEPRDPGARFGRAMSLLLSGREAEARRHLEESLAATGGSPPLEHLLARLLATAEDPAVRDGARALELARNLFERQQTLDHAETVAMAHAELGAFDAALDWQRRVLEHARTSGQERLLPRLEARRQRYARGEAVRAPWREGG